NGFMYVFGGTKGGAFKSSLAWARLMPNGTLSSFTSDDNFPDPNRDSPNVIIANGYLYVVGGNLTTNKPAASTYFIHLNANGSVGTWNQSQYMLPEPRAYTGAVYVNGNIYVIAGENAATLKNTVYYTPLARVQIAGTLDLIGLTSGNVGSA